MKETYQAKIRNRLGPYWNLVQFVERYFEEDPDTKEFLEKLIKQSTDRIRKKQHMLLECVDVQTKLMNISFCATIWYKEFELKRNYHLKLQTILKRVW